VTPQVFKGSGTNEISEAERQRLERGEAVEDLTNVSATEASVSTQPSHDEQTETITPTDPPAPNPKVQTEVIPAPPLEMVNMIVTDLEITLTSMPVPSYVKDSGMAFIEALRNWAAEGKA
jgi:hypothetical protein